jgi:hypothetical protein
MSRRCGVCAANINDRPNRVGPGHSAITGTAGGMNPHPATVVCDLIRVDFQNLVECQD